MTKLQISLRMHCSDGFKLLRFHLLPTPPPPGKAIVRLITASLPLPPPRPTPRAANLVAAHYYHSHQHH